MAQGSCIGWLSGDDLFLEPMVSYQVARGMGGAEGLTLSEQSLRRRLHDHGLLVSTDIGRQMLTVRRTLNGCTRQVLHLKAAVLGPVEPTVCSGLNRWRHGLGGRDSGETEH